MTGQQRVLRVSQSAVKGQHKAQGVRAAVKEQHKALRVRASLIGQQRMQKVSQSCCDWATESAEC